MSGFGFGLLFFLYPLYCDYKILQENLLLNLNLHCEISFFAWRLESCWFDSELKRIIYCYVVRKDRQDMFVLVNLEFIFGVFHAKAAS